MGWIILAVVVVIAIVLVAGNEANKRTEAAGAEWLRRRKAQENAAIDERDAYLEKNGFRKPAIVTVEDREGAISLEGDTLRLVSYILDTSFSVLKNWDLTKNELFEVHLVREGREETFTRTVTTPLVVNKKKSAIGRGLVGGVLLGPAGLVLGAASGIAPSSKVIQHESEVTDVRVVEGPPTLTLVTRRPDEPMLKVQFASPEVAESWLYRIQVMLEAPRVTG